MPETLLMFFACECGQHFATAIPMPKQSQYTVHCPACGHETSNGGEWGYLAEPEAMEVSPISIIEAIKKTG